LLNENELEKAYDIVEGYTRLNSIRRPEALYKAKESGKARYYVNK
jgi:hypothetical protein